MPKSASHGPSGSSRMLAGVTSRWTSPAAWAASSPAAIAATSRRPSSTGERAGRDPVGQRPVARERHGQVAAPLALAVVEDRHHGGVAHRAEGVALALEAHPEAGVGPERRVHHLHGGHGAALGVAGAVDRRLPAAPDALAELPGARDAALRAAVTGGPAGARAPATGSTRGPPGSRPRRPPSGAGPPSIAS